VGGQPEVDFPRVLERARTIVEEVHEKKRLIERPKVAGVLIF
jgi:hypothetical protein